LPLNSSSNGRRHQNTITDEGHSSSANLPVAPVESVETASADLQAVDVNSLELTRPRTVGVEQLGLWAMQQLNFLDLLAQLAINGAQIAALVVPLSVVWSVWVRSWPRTTG